MVIFYIHCTKMKFSIKDFSSKCDQISRKLRIWSHLLKKSLMENFIFCAVIQSAKCTLKWKNIKLKFSVICSQLWGFWILIVILKAHQMSHRYSSSCIFSSDKISRWQYFIVSPNYVQENEKMLKNDIFQSFSFIFCGLENIWGDIEKPSKFQQLLFTENNWKWYCPCKICKCKIKI